MNIITKFFKKGSKVRTDVDYLGEMAGHKWYKPSIIDDSITDRYLDYMALSNQFDTLGLKYNDLHDALSGVQEALRQNKTSLAVEINSALISYVELSINNDAIFSIVNCFIMVDDEPLERISPEYTKIKKDLYTSNDDVKIFFCECYNGLRIPTSNSQENTDTYGYLKSRLLEVSERLYLRGLKMAKDLK